MKIAQAEKRLKAIAEKAGRVDYQVSYTKHILRPGHFITNCSVYVGATHISGDGLLVTAPTFTQALLELKVKLNLGDLHEEDQDVEG